jgi:beta-lactamase superfamily II metal-dependent hydrolase
VSVVHFLNVLNGDCSIIQHNSQRVSVIDVCNASKPAAHMSLSESLGWEFRKHAKFARMGGVGGNYNQKEHPENPVAYLKKIGVPYIHRFIATHPDMDHLDGIKDLFDEFAVFNFWDTDNNKEIDNFTDGRYSSADWAFYKNLRDTKPRNSPCRLALHSGDYGPYYNRDESGNIGGDGLVVLAPTPQLVRDANESGDYNDCSYVLLYRTAFGQKILFGGDSHDDTWDHILANHADAVRDVHVLLAPHHGRDSGRSHDYLSVVNPKLTLLGNAESENLAYGAWQARDLPYFTNNNAGTVILCPEQDVIWVYCSNYRYAEDHAKHHGYATHKHAEFDAYYLTAIKTATPSLSGQNPFRSSVGGAQPMLRICTPCTNEGPLPRCLSTKPSSSARSRPLMKWTGSSTNSTG